MEKNTALITKFGKEKTNTGATEVQIALLTKRIRHLTEHLKQFKKDNHTRYGLLKLVGRRKRLLRYLQNSNLSAYRDLLKALSLRK